MITGGRAAAGVAASLAFVLLSGACAQDRTEIDVFAASSLTDAFTQFEEQFEAANPDIDIRLNLAGSNVLLRQISDGAEAEVFAPADSTMLEDPSLTLSHPDATSTSFARNTLVAIIPTDSDLSLLQLLEPGRTIARCTSGVPCGDLTDQWLAASGTRLQRTSMEANVRSVLTKVRLGEVDAGFVYRTDALAAKDEVRLIELEDAPRTTISIASLSNASNPSSGADLFVQFVLSEEGALVLAELGFDRP